MIIAATSDVHSPIYYDDFIKSLDSLTVKPDIFILAGDMSERGTLEEELIEWKKISSALFGKTTSGKIIACFGNTEFEEYRDVIANEIKEITFLNDKGMILNINGFEISIFGSTGGLDEPTRWQKTHIPNIDKIYQSRYEQAKSFFSRVRTGFRILLTHYASTYKTLEGENINYYPNIGSRQWEDIMRNKMVDLAIHGHSHKGSPFAWVNSTPVFNVAFPVNKKIVIIDTEKTKPGLKKFV